MVKVVRAVACAVCAGVLCGAVFAQSKEMQSVPALKEIRRWTKVNPRPLKLPTLITTFCRPVTQIETSQNPHRDQYFTVYVNKAGKAAMARGLPAYPRGSVIVKEKLPSKNARQPELLTVMMKREEGYDHSGGDWEYAVLDGGGVKVLESGKLTHCRSCHAAQKSSDFVFRTYVPRKDREAGSYRP